MKKINANDKYYLFFTDIFVFLSMLSFFCYGATTNGVQKDVCYEYLAEAAIKQEKHHLIHGVYENAEHLSYEEFRTLQKTTYGNVFYRRLNSYFVAGANNNFIDFSMNFDGLSNTEYHVKAISGSTYTNTNKMIETLNLELYKTIQDDQNALPGFDGNCYLPSTIADEIIDSDLLDNLNNYDDIINQHLSFTISGNYGDVNFLSRWTVNNIFYTDIGHHDGDDAEGYLYKDKGYGITLYNLLGPFIVAPLYQVHLIDGSTYCFDFYNSLFLPKEYIEYAFGKNYAENGSEIFFYTYENGNDSWRKIDTLLFFNDLYNGSYSFFYGGNLFYFFAGIASISLALLPLSKLSIAGEEDEFIDPPVKKVPLNIQLLALFLPFFLLHFIYNVTIRFLPLSIEKLLAYNIVGTTTTILITCHILLMFILPKAIKQAQRRRFK